MSLLKYYKDKTKVKAVADEIESIAKPGDVILTDGEIDWGHGGIIKNIGVCIAYAGIRSAQKSLFNGNFTKIKTDKTRATHITRFFGNAVIRTYRNHPKIVECLNKYPDASTFSVEPPKALLIPTTDYACDIIRILRPTWKQIDEDDIKLMLDGIISMLGTAYDKGQLVGILYDQENGEPFQESKGSWVFDFGGDKKVCSVGIGVDDAYLKYELEKKGIDVPRTFSILNPNAWTEKFIKKFNNPKRGKLVGKWDVERHYPAMYEDEVCAKYFNHEYKQVAEFHHGKRIA